MRRFWLNQLALSLRPLSFCLGSAPALTAINRKCFPKRNRASKNSFDLKLAEGPLELVGHRSRNCVGENCALQRNSEIACSSVKRPVVERPIRSPILNLVIASLSVLLSIFLGSSVLFPSSALAGAIASPTPPPANLTLAQAAASGTAEASLTAAEPNAPLLFEQNCAACHAGGGNVIRRGKNLKTKALKRYGMDSHEAIANIITNGKGIMSAYGEAAENGAPTRLTAAEIDALANYVLAQAAVDWK